MEQFSEDLSILVNNEKFSDVQFYIGDRKVYAHKAILMARSHYFKAMFCDAMKEATAKVSYKVTKLLILSLYNALMTFDALQKKAFEKHCGKRRKCW